MDRVTNLLLVRVVAWFSAVVAIVGLYLVAWLFALTLGQTWWNFWMLFALAGAAINLWISVSVAENRLAGVWLLAVLGLSALLCLSALIFLAR